MLTAIVINFGVTAFILALIYRSWWLAQLGDEGDTLSDEHADDAEAATEAASTRSIGTTRPIRRVLDESNRARRRSRDDQDSGARRMNALVPLVVLIPLIGAAIALMFRSTAALQVAISVIALALVGDRDQRGPARGRRPERHDRRGGGRLVRAVRHRARRRPARPRSCCSSRR